MKFNIKNISKKHKNQIKNISSKLWGSNIVVSMGKIYEVDKLNGFVAIVDKKIIGFVTYYIDNNECEIVALYSEIENKGVGTALVDKIKEVSKTNKCKRIKLITTNDNIKAFAFYQKRGFTIANINIDGIKKSRELKPQIPLIGENDIPIRDEIEFELKY